MAKIKSFKKTKLGLARTAGRALESSLAPKKKVRAGLGQSKRAARRSAREIERAEKQERDEGFWARERAKIENGRLLAPRMAERLLEAPEAVGLEEIMDTYVLMRLMGEYERGVQDAVAQVYGQMGQEDNEYWLEVAGKDREFGLHSNIPACCVEFFVSSQAIMAERYPELGQIARSRLAAAIRWYERREIFVLADEDRPEYHSCPKCTHQLVRGEIKPNELHACEDPAEHPLCDWAVGAEGENT